MAYTRMVQLLTTILLLATLALPILSITFVDSPSLTTGTLSIGDENIFYTDTGAPSGKKSYTTLFLVHGMSFNSGIFKKTQSSAFRIVALNRRGYQGSTPYTTAELNVITNGTVTQKTTFLADRGVEIALFMDGFLQEKQIATGGIALVGWSVGNIFTLSALSSVNSWPADVKSRLAPRIKAVIMQEPSAEILGFTSNPNNWIPLIDTSIPESTRGQMTVQWITHYFKHGDFTQDPNSISWVVPSISRIPSIFSMSSAEYNSIVELGAASDVDFSILIGMSSLLHQSYRDAIFGDVVKAAFPKIKKSLFTGDTSVSFGPYAYFLVKNDTSTAGDNSVNLKVVPGVNHFINWDDPQTAAIVYSQLI